MAKKRSDGRYQISKVINGKRKFFYGRTKKEATEKMNTYTASVSDCINYSPTLTLQEWASRWLEIKKDDVQPNTLNSYKQVINKHILPTIGFIPLVDISVTTVRKLLETKQKENLSTRTQGYIYTVLSAILSQAVNDDIITKNVAKKIKKPRLVKTRAMSTLAKAEVQQFLGVISNAEHHALFKLAFSTGLRRSELLGLRWVDVDFKKSTITVNQTVVKVGTKATLSQTTKNRSSRRTISIDGQTLAELKKQLIRTQKRRLSTPDWINNDLVFPGEKGSPRYPDYISRLCKQYASKINRNDFSFHGIRHTHATLLIESGVNFKVIQVRLGHASFTETMNTYSHITPILEDDVVNKIASIF